MKCPDCGDELKQESVIGFDDSFRCPNCGGFFMEGWVVNRIAAGEMKDFTPAINQPMQPRPTGVCPRDLTKMFGAASENFPPDLRVEKCNTCNWWWFPGNDLFLLRDAYEAKQNFVKLWKKPEMTAFILPIVSVVILVVGIVGGLNMLRAKQTITTSAETGISQFTVNKRTVSEVELKFRSERITEQVSYRKAGTAEWTTAPVTFEDGMYKVTITGLVSRTEYEVEINGNVFRFNTK